METRGRWPTLRAVEQPTTEGKRMHAEHSQAVTEPFSPSEVEQFRADDVHAARTVVSLMMGIFLLGVVLYSIIAVIAAM
ncbi:MAG: hypothetical protein NZ700_10100 [Gemmataceae bacterium]|nr:hypothetical protein [Gemmataceae bacterium]MDW8264033.1 hypothetical protein [Gemmataceae bacterium]